MTEKSITPMNTIRATSHRSIFFNAMTMRAGDNDIQIALCLEHGGGQNIFLEEALVVMTPKTAKLLAMALNQAVGLIEKNSGEIKVPDVAISAVEIKNAR